MDAILTLEEKAILDIIKDSSDISDVDHSVLLVEEVCPDDLVPDVFGEFKARLGQYKYVLEEYAGIMRENRSEEHIGEDDFNPYLEYERLKDHLDEILSKISSNVGAQQSSYLDCMMPLLTFGMYTPIDDRIHLFVNTIRNYASTKGYNPAYLLATVYIHECYHAYVNHKAQLGGQHYIREIEEPMAECYMLNYFKHAYEKTKNPTLLDIYNLSCKTVRDKQNGLTAAYGYGFYLHKFSQCNHGLSSTDICEEYSIKAKELDHNSINIIRYCMELMLDYPTSSPVRQEGEKSLFELLIHQILNVGQKQELSFVEIFNNTKSELKTVLLEKWQPKNNFLDKSYQNQIESIIDNTVSENILVENMAPWQSARPVYKNGFDYTKIINQDLLRFLPYEHQVKSWEALLSPNTPFKSMVVTTGTGSGKTESFMVPLIADLAKSNATGLKALFLYPLNALMEDQKEKLNDLIERSGSKLTFAVYNASSPEGDYDPQIGATAFTHEVLYREQIRGYKWDINTGRWISGGQVPDIVLTNPTMLEYMLLRRSDKSIINNSLQKLSWIVIDETHSYSGAGADELAMLLRRVLKAFDRKADDVHFATSSATVGNSDAALLKFISGITGQACTTPHLQPIKIIKGHRSLPDFSLSKPSGGYSKSSILSLLANNDYVYLKDLIPYMNSTEERLKELDRLSNGGLKVKVHFFVEALTNGLFANMEDIINGANTFKLTQEIPFDDSTYRLDSRYLQVMHCTGCGAVLANANIDSNNNYSRVRSAFSLYSRFIGINRNSVSRPQPNTAIGDILPGNLISFNKSSGDILISGDCSCPFCGAKNTESEKSILPFSVSSSLTMMSISPVLLNNSAAHTGGHPYEGKQFISFADSRRGAAEPSLEQNLETENRWVISTILNKLSNRGSFNYVNEEITKLRDEAIQRGDIAESGRLLKELVELSNANQDNDQQKILLIANRNGVSGLLNWEYVLDSLFLDSNCSRLAACFAKEKDWDASSGALSVKYLRRYVLGALYNAMNSRSKFGISPESYGLFKVVYKDLDNLSLVPNEVKTLNAELLKRKRPTISLDDWKDFLKIYLDFHVRTNENLYFQASPSSKWDELDINDCRNLKTRFGKRRSIKNPELTYGVHFKLLWRLFGCENEKQLMNLDPNLPGLISDVVKAMWVELTQTLKIIEIGYTYRKQYGATHKSWQKDYLSKYEEKKEHRTNYRLNVNKISFSLCERAFIDENVKAILDTTFLGHTPYQDDFCDNPVMPVVIPVWQPPYPADKNELEAFYKGHNVPYLFCSYIRDIYAQRPFFIQYEHTAQVGRELTKSRIADFKNHEINILACSTTMEMGVDIGELEIVSMSNVPPHPANYKQRVGRAGRAFQNKSTSVTICNSDAVGLSVMAMPKENLIERELLSPSADLNSPQVIQRHINSYLLRKYLVDGNIPSVFANRSIKNYDIIDFFFDAKYDVHPPRIYPNNWRELRETIGNTSTTVYPISYNATFHNHSLYEGFLNWLLNLNQITDKDIWDDLDLLKSGTALSGKANRELIDNSYNAVKSLFDGLSRELTQIQNNSAGQDPAGNKIVDANGNPLVDWTANPITGYTARLQYDFMGLLMEKLMIYCSTHQFTPNANMPVNIVKLKINHDDELYSNPSRDLVVALTEYSPGKSVVIDGKSYTIAGVDWDRSKSFPRIHICKKCGYVWENGVDTQCPSCGHTDVRHNDMIEPTAFLPELETDRIIDKGATITSVKAQLIGANGIHTTLLSPLCDYDVEYPNAGTKILYLNEGVGFGYCICTKFDCGRANVETKVAAHTDTQYLRELMYSRIDPDNPNQPPTYEHQNLTTLGQDFFAPSDLKRNLFIGGSISTNYSILKPYHSGRGARQPFMSVNPDLSILVTLGLLVCEELSKIIPCQRQDIDFLITTIKNGERALCIYDTAKGGAGYSSYLDKTNWLIMLDTCKQKLDDIINKKTSIESMFSRTTLKYLEDVDLLATYSWLNDEFHARQPIPKMISQSFKSSVVHASLSDIAKEISLATNATLFVQGNTNSWNYELSNGAVPSWKDMRGMIRLSGSKKTELVFCGNPGIIPVEAVDIVKHSEDWAIFAISQNPCNYYPLAFVNGILYITDDLSTACFNGLWGSGNIYAVSAPKPTCNPYTPILSGYSEFYISKMSLLRSSKDLLDLLLQKDSSHQISDFIKNARGHSIEITYMDEHLKTQLGIIISTQLIDAFVNKLGCRSFTVKFANEKFYDYYGKQIDNPNRSLTDSFQSSDDSNQMLDEILSNSGWAYSIDTKPAKALPHWRSLVIKDLDAKCVLTIKPHGGIANGWYINTAITQAQHKYFGASNSSMSSDIPLISSKENEILYTIGLS